MRATVTHVAETILADICASSTQNQELVGRHLIDLVDGLAFQPLSFEATEVNDTTNPGVVGILVVHRTQLANSTRGLFLINLPSTIFRDGGQQLAVDEFTNGDYNSLLQ